MILIVTPFPLTGCSTPTPIEPPSEEALFCDVVSEPFRYRQEEIDARTAGGWTANLAREYRINLSLERECKETPPG